MAYSITKQSGQQLYNVKEFVVDTAIEVNDLPVDCEIGSTALVISNSTVWVLGTDRIWHQL